jgi:hypothetical protein
MKILVFTEGTIIMHPSGLGVSREERVQQVKNKVPDVSHYGSYVPIGNAPEKLRRWQSEGVEICYLTSRKTVEEVNNVKNVLNKYDFPKGEVYYRKQGEEYRNVAEHVAPDVIVEDDCESIGGEPEMTYSHMSEEAKKRTKLFSVREFGGIDHLPDVPKLLGVQSK